MHAHARMYNYVAGNWLTLTHVYTEQECLCHSPDCGIRRPCDDHLLVVLQAQHRARVALEHFGALECLSVPNLQRWRVRVKGESGGEGVWLQGWTMEQRPVMNWVNIYAHTYVFAYVKFKVPITINAFLYPEHGTPWWCCPWVHWRSCGRHTASNKLPCCSHCCTECALGCGGHVSSSAPCSVNVQMQMQ